MTIDPRRTDDSTQTSLDYNTEDTVSVSSTDGIIVVTYPDGTQSQHYPQQSSTERPKSLKPLKKKKKKRKNMSGIERKAMYGGRNGRR